MSIEEMADLWYLKRVYESIEREAKEQPKSQSKQYRSSSTIVMAATSSAVLTRDDDMW